MIPPFECEAGAGLLVGFSISMSFPLSYSEVDNADKVHKQKTVRFVLRDFFPHFGELATEQCFPHFVHGMFTHEFSWKNYTLTKLGLHSYMTVLWDFLRS